MVATSNSTKSLIYSISIALLIALVVEHRVFFDITAINDDVRNQIYWMAKLLDPDYFQNDYIASYFTQPSMISPCLYFIYWCFTEFLDPKIISQILPFFIIVLTVYFLFKAAELYAGPKYAFWVCYVFNLYIWTMKYIAGGLPRSFFYLLFFLFLWLLSAKKWFWLVFCFALQTLIYPTAFFLSIAVLAIEIIGDKIQKIEINMGKIKAFFLGVFIGGSTLCLRYLYKATHEYGPLTSLSEALKMPEFYIDGRACAFIVPFKVAQTGFGSGLLAQYKNELLIGFYCLFVFTVVLIVGYWIFTKFVLRKTEPFNNPRYLYSSAIASILLFIIANLVLFYLYLPHRYITYIFPLILVFLLGNVLYHIELAFPRKPMGFLRSNFVVSLAAQLIIWSIAIAVLLLASSGWHDDLISLNKQERKVYNFLQTVPKDALIAAPLKLASNIPAFTYRSVLISSETNIPFHKDYYEEVKTRVEDLDRAYNTKDPNEIIQFVKKYHIDYIVVDLELNPELDDTVLKTVARSRVVFSTKRYVTLGIS